MKTNRPLWLLLAALAGLPAAAGAADSNRYLLVFETTRAMKRDMAAARQCVQDLVTGDFADQARDGDTLGVWTYDTSLHAGTFPMLEWTVDGETDIGQHLDAFLKQQHCKGDAHFDLVMAELNRVISNSDSITILIFSDGFDPIQGTPFDASINGVYAQHRDELRDAHVPFVTLLQAQGGKIVHGTVDSAVGPIDIPAPASKPSTAFPPPAAIPAPAPVTPPVAVVAKPNPPLILDYSKVAPPVAAPSPAASQAPAVPANNPPPSPGLLASAISTITNMMNVGPSIAVSKASAPAVPAVTTADNGPAAPAAAPPQAVATAPGNNATQGGLILAGLGLLLALGGLAALFFWRSRSTPRASVITESFKQSKK